jgi:hypothetical protein
VGWVGKRLVPLLVAAIVALVAGDVLGLVITSGGDEASPAELVSSTRAFVDARKDTAFTGHVSIEQREEGGGGSFVQRLTLKGVAHVPDHSRFVVTTEGSASEVITIGNVAYVREATDESALEAEKWAELDPQSEDERAGIVRQQGLAAGADQVGDPITLLRIIGSVRNAALVRRTGDVSVVAAAIDPTQAFGSALGGQIDQARLELSIGPAGRLVRAAMTAKGSGESVSADYRFSRWGTAVTVAAPPKAELDPTPFIDEEDLAAFKDAPVLQPRGIPAGWVLDGAFVLSADETAEGCRQVELDYTDPDNPDAGYLTIYQLPVACADLARPEGSAPFAAGRWSGYIDESDGGSTAQIVVGATVVQAETDLPSDALARVLSDLIPLDTSKPPAELEGFGPTTGA